MNLDTQLEEPAATASTKRRRRERTAAAPTAARSAPARVVGVDRRLRTVIPTAFVAMWVAAIPARTWPAMVAVVAAAAAVVAVGVMTINGFTLLQWTALRIRVGRRRRRGRAFRPEPAPAQEAVVAGQAIGVIWDGGQLICALDLHGNPHVPHWLAQRRMQTSATVPLDVLEKKLAEIDDGQPCSVDLVFDATRLAITPYSSTYDTQLSGRPVAGSRHTFLIARFAPADTPPYYAARTSLPEAAATTLTRIGRALAAVGCPCTPLTAAQLDELAARTRTRAEHWKYLTVDSDAAQTDTLYCIDPSALNDVRFPELWSVRTDSVIATLRRDSRGRWAGFARIRGVRPPTAPPLPFFKELPGQQAAAATIGRPVADTAPLTTIFEPVHSLANLTAPAGPDGQILGMTDVGKQLLMPLVPSTERVVAARVHPLYAEQLVLRAAATGAIVTIVTTDTARWAPLTGSRIRLARQERTCQPDPPTCMSTTTWRPRLIRQPRRSS
ncbi:type VII secretion protein EccE [Mycolicibacterium goodii]|uniref:type VII secretion protein EccE n=1 Tax=Mycolicibacterium goodii TaxID=134601 RepID=UPI001BDD96FD|nr:type VII secretion protein EccE [Mycolicibacterium goodii]MBU8817532.1 type VII secretion protein EccE [Mycolicibacterium goodii]